MQTGDSQTVAVTRSFAPSRAAVLDGSCSVLSLALLVACAGATAAAVEPEEDAPELRDRLTEREDENRLEQPIRFDWGGGTLFLGGQLEGAVEHFEHRALDDEGGSGEQLLWDKEIEAELFYSRGAVFSAFVQLRAAAERDYAGATEGLYDRVEFERGELWVSSLNVFGSGLDVEVGRLNFEDDRLWWWDADLDALRMSREFAVFDLSLAAAREWAPARYDLHRIDPEQQGVSRWIAEAGWEWRPDHELEAFALWQRDHSRRDLVGASVRDDRVDESDARLHWLGLRASGARDSPNGLFGYWLDAATVRGDERLHEFEDDAGGFRVIEAVQAQTVEGWAYDLGATWIFHSRWQPRISLGLARGSGDGDDEDGREHAFRQTGIHGNEVGFGGVERFPRYGLLLAPELSNLAVTTIGLGVSPTPSSSLDLVYHHYRLVKPAESLRDSEIELLLDEERRSLGTAIDLILAIEEGERFEWYVGASVFRPGQAVRAGAERWLTGSYLLARLAF